MLNRTNSRRRSLVLSALAAVAAIGIAISSLHAGAPPPVAAATPTPIPGSGFNLTSSYSKVDNPSNLALAHLRSQPLPTPVVPFTPGPPWVNYMDSSAQGGQPTLVIVPANYPVVPVGAVQPGHPFAYTTERLDAAGWSVVPNLALITGDTSAEADLFPIVANHTYTFRICTHWVGEPNLGCSDSMQYTSPIVVPLP
jgi:hypothetical protein